MVRRLNGWQRLWVVLSVLYLVPVIGIAVILFPKQESLDESRVYDSISAVVSYVEKTEKARISEGVYTIRSKHYGDLPNDEIIQRLHEKWCGKVDFTTIEEDYKQKLDALPTERAKTAGIAFLAWLVPVIALYVLGLAIGWIIRGFRRENL
jgi:hypothetical protein